MVSDLLSTSDKDLRTPVVKHRSEKRLPNIRKGSRGCRLAHDKAQTGAEQPQMCSGVAASLGLRSHWSRHRRQSTLLAYQTPLATPMALGKIYSAHVQSDLWLAQVRWDLGPQYVEETRRSLSITAQHNSLLWKSRGFSSLQGSCGLFGPCPGQSLLLDPGVVQHHWVHLQLPWALVLRVSRQPCQQHFVTLFTS